MGYVPDLEMKSSVYKSKKRLGVMGKRQPCRNYDGYLEHILQSYKDYQGITEPIWAWIRIGDEVAYKHFSHWHL